MRAITKVLCFVLSACCLCSCFTMVDLQEAKVLEKGENQLGLSSGYFVPAEDEGALGLDGGMFYKVGLGQKFEFTTRVSWFMAARFDLKYQFYENPSNTLFMATGFNLGTTAFTFEEQLGNIKFQAPFYMTYSPAPWLSFYGNVKYSYQVPRRFGTNGLHLITYNSGLRIGKKAGMMLEINHVPFFNEQLGIPLNFREISQVHGGLFLNF